VVHANLANFDTHAGMKFDTQIEECANISISIILPVFVYTSCAIKIW
jgi:hypothetical protein